MTASDPASNASLAPVARPVAPPAAPALTRTIQDTMLLGLAYAFSAAVGNFVPSIAIGRTLGAAPLGVYALAVSASRVFYAGTDLGLGPQLTRAAARDPGAGAARLLGLFLTARTLLVPAGAAVVVAAATLLGARQTLAVVFTAAALGLVKLQLLYDAYLVGLGALRAVGALTILSSAALLAASAAWWATGGGLTRFTALYLVSAAIGLAAWAWHGRRLGHRPAPRWDPDALLAELRQSFPIGVSLVLVHATAKAPVLVLAALRPEGDVGCFSAAEIFVAGCAIAQGAVTAVVFPRLAAAGGPGTAAFRRLARRSNVLLASVGAVAALLLAALGAPLVEAFFPDRDFAGAAQVMPILGASVPLLLLQNHNVFVFAAADHQRLGSLVMVAGFVAMVTLLVALVPPLGVVGAAWATLAARALGVVFLLVGASRLPRRP